MFKKVGLLSVAILITVAVLLYISESNYASTSVPDLVDPPRPSALRAPLIFEDVDEILESVGMAKFSEFAIAEIMPLNIPDDVPAHGFDILQDITILYEPVYVRNDFEMVGISVHGSSSLTFHHGNAAGEPANFIWSRSIAAENATTDFFGRGAIAEFFVERNGINFAVTEWVTRETREPDGWVVAWAQDGQAFMASLPASYTEEEILAFCDAQSILSWELEGNAVSISVQGMENVSIFENAGPVALSGNFDSMDSEIIVMGNALYRAGLGRSIERVGYRWLIDETLHRYQYVLQPGNYTFHAEGIIGEPGLFSRHFYNGGVVESIDFSEELANLNSHQFSLMVTEDNSELILTTTYQRLSFNLGGTPISPTNPSMILSIDVPTGANILSFLSTYHDGFPIGNPTRESYTFRGWYMDASFEIAITETTIMPSMDATLFARWDGELSPREQGNYISITIIGNHNMTEGTTIGVWNDNIYSIQPDGGWKRVGDVTHDDWGSYSEYRVDQGYYDIWMTLGFNPDRSIADLASEFGTFSYGGDFARFAPLGLECCCYGEIVVTHVQDWEPVLIQRWTWAGTGSSAENLSITPIGADWMGLQPCEIYP